MLWFVIPTLTALAVWGLLFGFLFAETISDRFWLLHQSSTADKRSVVLVFMGLSVLLLNSVVAFVKTIWGLF